jgi:CheY-like chemotaxis protein
MNPDKRVLVVDDDSAIREFVSMALEDEGYEVVTAPHGAAALELVRQEAPRAIVLDMRMPVMDGWEFSRVYRQLPGPHAPIIVATAARDVEERAAQVQADAFLGKPFDLDALLGVVEQCIKSGRGGRC